MNIEVLNPENLEYFNSYIQELNELINSINQFKSKPINLFHETEKISDSTNVLFQILQKIYVIMPLKLDRKKGAFKLSKKPDDNLFYKNTNVPYIKPRLVKILNKENSWFFIFNYFFRNAQMHYKHLVNSPSQVGDDTGITSFGIHILIDKESHSFNLIRSLFKGKNTFVKKYNLISINKKSKQEYEMAITIKISFIREIVMSIKAAFTESLKKLLHYIEKINETKLISKYNKEKKIYQTVINEWLESISNLP